MQFQIAGTFTPANLKPLWFSLSFRTQSRHCGFGQCWKDNHPVSVVSWPLKLWKSGLVPLDALMFCSRADSLTKEAVHTSPTIGSNVEQITVRKTHFLVWDIGGQESLRASWYSYYCNTEVRKDALFNVTFNALCPQINRLDLHLSDCHPGGGQHRPRTPQSDQRGAPSDALTRGRNKSSGCSGLWSRLLPFRCQEHPYLRQAVKWLRLNDWTCHIYSQGQRFLMSDAQKKYKVSIQG